MGAFKLINASFTKKPDYGHIQKNIKNIASLQAAKKEIEKEIEKEIKKAEKTKNA